MAARILIIGSLPEEVERIGGWLGRQFHAEVEHDSETAWQRLGEETFDAVLLEHGLLDARRVLARLEGSSPGCFLILFGDAPTPRQALGAVTAGAFTFVLRPLSAAVLVGATKRGLRNRKKLLRIMNMADELHEANRGLLQQKRRLQAEKKDLSAKGRHLNLINELSSAAGATLDPCRIVGSVGSRLCRELPITSWAVLFAPSPNERATLFVPGPMNPARTVELARGMLAKLGRVGGNAASWEALPLGRRVVSETAAMELASEHGLFLPLLAAGQPIGLYKLLPQEVLSSDLIRLAESAANIVALGLRNAGELLHARKLADHDDLTRIANRRAFERQLRQEFSRSRRYRQPLSLIMADIDHFKYVNDRFGHHVGDKALCQVSRAIARVLRDSDFVARYGGEEFAVILPQTDLDNSMALARRIKEVVARKSLVSATQPVKLTISLGIADSEAPEAEEPRDLVRMADQALYLSKQSGRNRISTWRDLTSHEVLDAPFAKPEYIEWRTWEEVR
ncbi:MAG: GGDEF domain-containing protein [Pseudomonadota bacterium]